MTKYVFRPEKLGKGKSAYQRHMETVARECLLWRMTLEQHDALTQEEYTAWVSAWNQLQKEG